MTREEWREAVRERAVIVHRRRLMVPTPGPLVESGPDGWSGWVVPLAPWSPDHPGWVIAIKYARLATADELLTGIVSPRTRKEQSCR